VEIAKEDIEYCGFPTIHEKLWNKEAPLQYNIRQKTEEAINSDERELKVNRINKKVTLLKN
jgi:hypothetical protein